MPPRDKAFNARLVNAARATKMTPMPKVKDHHRRKPIKTGRSLIFKGPLLKRIPLSYPSIWKQMQDGTFPRSVLVGGKVAWFEDDIDLWMANLLQQKLKIDNEKEPTTPRKKPRAVRHGAELMKGS